MGKATELVEGLRNRPLTADEIRSRRAAMEISDDDAVVTSDGTFETSTPQGVPRQIAQVEPEPWD